jgi:hypothetical protein
MNSAKAGQEAYEKAADKKAFFPETADVDQLREKGSKHSRSYSSSMYQFWIVSNSLLPCLPPSDTQTR